EGKISRRSTGWLGREDNRRLQPLRYLHDCSDCFRLERLPGGVCTHWKAPPCHGAHSSQTSRHVRKCQEQTSRTFGCRRRPDYRDAHAAQLQYIETYHAEICDAVV